MADLSLRRGERDVVSDKAWRFRFFFSFFFGVFPCIPPRPWFILETASAPKDTFFCVGGEGGDSPGRKKIHFLLRACEPTRGRDGGIWEGGWGGGETLRKRREREGGNAGVFWNLCHGKKKRSGFREN